MLLKWEELPQNMKNDCVRKYYNILYKKRFSILLKRIFDLILGLLILFLFLPIFLIISVLIKLNSRGALMFRQVRVTQYGKQFRIFKFRTMVINAEKIGCQVTIENDNRVTKVGKLLRKYRLDELPQLLNIISGDMSFVGTRPEVVKYVEKYSDSMLATLLLPAGVTSEASIRYKDEQRLLVDTNDIDNLYIKKILPSKMKINLKSLEEFSLLSDIKTIFRTVLAVLGLLR